MLRRVAVLSRLPEVLSAEADGEKGYADTLFAMLLEQAGMMAQKIGKCFLEPLRCRVGGRRKRAEKHLRARRLHKAP